jgi:uncharacterized protein
LSSIHLAMSSVEPICLITGASAGIGAALARVFARHGHRLVLTARREAQLVALADEIETSGQPRPHVIVGDVSTAEGRTQLADGLSAAGLEPAFVVNNAGFGLLGPATRLSAERQLDMIDLNTRALTDLSLRWIESITRHKGGILNVASVAGFMPGHGMAVYHATKAYVVSFTEALHSELKADGVRACALCPGPVATEFLAQAGVPDGYWPTVMARSAERVAREGYEGLMGGHRVVVPGGHNRIVTLLPRLLPRGWMLALTHWRWVKARRRGG